MLMRVKGDRHIWWALPVAALRWLSWTAAVLVLCGGARGQVTLRDQGFVPFRDEPINYLSDRVNDPVARLQQRIDQGAVALEFSPKNGYLESVLKYLQVPVSPQTLVFSKTSFQYKKISPSTPRALYFNDNVYVGWVPNGHSLEIASFDPSQGAIFYLLDQQATDQPAFVRATLDCTQCHVAPGTRGMPGVLVAYRPADARAKGLPEPTDPDTHTRVKNPTDVFKFSFPDLDGNTVSNTDARFAGNVVVAVVTGTWCPNCHDEAQFLVELDRKYRDRGLRVVALDFEEPEQQEDGLKRARAFIKKYGVEYPYLIAGAPIEMWEKVPQAENLNSWPTTFFIGRDGRVKLIHAGFAAPASGEFHRKLREEFISTIERLLAENSTAAR
jgi:peroxiredoxin